MRRSRDAVEPRDRAGRPLRPIADIASELGIEPDELEPDGRTKAKVSLSVLDRLAARPDGKLIAVTAITPTPRGEGKSTTAVALTQGLARIGRRPVLCLREASLGPVFGIKGGAAGGGYSQVVPMEELNLHFTGDIHAITAANNLLAALIEAHLLHGNQAGIDPLTVTWRRCLDINDRALRDIVIGLGGKMNGYPRQTGFDITAASETMAIVAMARDLADLRRRLGAITVAETREGAPVTAEDIRAAGAMAVILKDALKPNLVQTIEGQPAFVHCGPFANIAHGNSSLVATRMALKLGELVVTESGFASDMGLEKLFDIVCRLGGLQPSAVVLVATVQALRHHGGGDLERGAANLARHIAIAKEFGDRAGRRGEPLPDRHRRRPRARAAARARARRARCRGQRRLRAGRGRRGGTCRGGRPRDRGADELQAGLRARRADRGEDRDDRDRGSTAPTASTSCPRRGRRSSGSPRSASTACRSAWQRRTCRSQTTRRC